MCVRSQQFNVLCNSSCCHASSCKAHPLCLPPATTPQFSKHMFRLEQEVYESEDIDWAHVRAGASCWAAYKLASIAPSPPDAA